MTILLTGADGFIGSQILNKLNEYNIEIIAFIYNYNEFIIKSDYGFFKDYCEKN